MEKREGKEIGACIYCGQFRYFDVEPGEKLTEGKSNGVSWVSSFRKMILPSY